MKINRLKRKTKNINKKLSKLKLKEERLIFKRHNIQSAIDILSIKENENIKSNS